MSTSANTAGQRKGDWMKTYCGRFWPLDPRPEEVSILDVAHALSRICRFGGHVREFYTVGQHSILVSETVERIGGSVQETFAALLHDAAEAYLGDMVRPLKRDMPRFVEVERGVEEAVAKRFDVAVPFDAPIVKFADEAVLAAEARDLMGGFEGWSLRADPIRDKVLPIADTSLVETLFLQRFILFERLSREDREANASLASKAKT